MNIRKCPKCGGCVPEGNANCNHCGHKMSILGGTGLYVKAALYDYNFSDEDISYNYDEYSDEELYKELLSVDPNTDVHPNNRKRVERAITY